MTLYRRYPEVATTSVEDVTFDSQIGLILLRFSGLALLGLDFQT